MPRTAIDKKPKADSAPRLDQLIIDKDYVKRGDSEPKAIVARALTQPEIRAATTIQKLDGKLLDVNFEVRELREQIAEVHKGNLQRPEAMLVTQAHTLDALFATLVRRSHANSNEGYLEAADRYMRLALRAQAQAQVVRTIEALAELKKSPAVLNRAAGQHREWPATGE